MGDDSLTIPTPVLSGSGVRVLVVYSIDTEVTNKSQPCGTPWLTSYCNNSKIAAAVYQSVYAVQVTLLIFLLYIIYVSFNATKV